MPTLRKTAFVLATVALVVGPTPGAAHAAPQKVPSGRQWVAYQSAEWPPRVTLTQMRGVGTHSPTEDVPGDVQTNPDWSPDGRRLVFANAERTDGRENLWIADADGGRTARLLDCVAPCRWLDDPAWSPDGTRVLYSRMSEIDGVSFASLETVRVADGHVDVLLTSGSDSFFAGQRWSPDGSRIVLEHVHKAGTPAEADVDEVTLTIVDLTTSPVTLTPITDPALWPATAEWSSDGRDIVYSALPAPDAEAPDLYVVSAATGVARRLTTLAATGGWAIQPDFTSDGTTVLFIAYIAETGSFGLAAVDRNGGAVRPALGSRYVPGFHPRDRPIGWA